MSKKNINIKRDIGNTFFREDKPIEKGKVKNKKQNKKQIPDKAIDTSDKGFNHYF